MKVVLISTYELGHQPFGLASPAAWLRRAGHEVSCVDTSQQALRDHESTITAADAVAFYLPMHTATRIAMHAMRRVRGLNPRARFCTYGLYAPMNAELVSEFGVAKIIGGEFEQELVDWVTAPLEPTEGLNTAPTETLISLNRLAFLTPDRSTLPPLQRYSKLRLPTGEDCIVGYTEATRGCKHLCRHCPIVPVYHGAFRVVQSEIVLADIRQQVRAGAQHITFGDPDFFNGPKHSIDIVEALHREFPAVTYDATIKVEHLLKNADRLPILKQTGCAFVVTAVESFDDGVLSRLDKGHTRGDFVRTVELFREVGLNLCPTFIAFHPWTTLDSYDDFLSTLAELDLVHDMPSIQLALRLLIPAASRLLELEEVQSIVAPFDRERLCHPWRNPDPRVDELQSEIEAIVQKSAKFGLSRQQAFAQVRWAVDSKMGKPSQEFAPLPDRATIPYLTEPWYC